MQKGEDLYILCKEEKAVTGHGGLLQTGFNRLTPCDGVREGRSRGQNARMIETE